MNIVITGSCGVAEVREIWHAPAAQIVEAMRNWVRTSGNRPGVMFATSGAGYDQLDAELTKAGFTLAAEALNPQHNFYQRNGKHKTKLWVRDVNDLYPPTVNNNAY